MTDTNEAFVMVPRDKLQYVRDLLTEKVYGSPARSPGHNARLEVDAMLSASHSPVSDMVSRDQEVERLRAALRPFAEAWDIATRDQRHLTLGEIGALAGHQVSGIHYRNARAAIGDST